MAGMSGYTKLFSSIVASTIWREDNETRIVWITMLALADRFGVVEASLPGLADLSRVSVDGARRAIVTLSSPDPDSRSHEAEGRRIAEIDGGWRIINHAKFRQKLSSEERREYKRTKAQEYRRRDRESGQSRQRGHNLDEGDTVQSTEYRVQSTDQTPSVSVDTAPPPVRQKPLAYKPRLDVAWPGRPPVPSSLHAEFVSKLGGDQATAAAKLFAWYPEAAAAYENQPIGDDDFRFWRARFREWVGTTERPVKPAADAGPTTEEVRRLLMEARAKERR